MTTIFRGLIPLIALFVMIHFLGLKFVIIIYGVLVILGIIGYYTGPITFLQFSLDVSELFIPKTKDLHFFIKSGEFYCSLSELKATIRYCPKYREWYCNELRYQGLSSIFDDLKSCVQNS